MNSNGGGAPRTVRASLVYGIAIFLSSSLLFFIEPIAGKRLLPLLGGSAAVWTACLVFFQSALLLGYLAAHRLVTRAGPRWQLAIYGGLLAVSLAQLGSAMLPASAGLRASASYPISSVLWLLALLIGLPFVTLSATSPLLQAWYARSIERAGTADVPAAHPYRLFAISNVGSLSALVVYPWLVEPRLTLRDQTAGLILGFTMLAAVCVVIAYSMRESAEVPLPTGASTTVDDASSADIRSRDRVLWISLAACGSLLLSAVTIHLSQNVATIPLLWIIPLIVYLLSFVVAFSNERWHPRWLVIAFAVAALGLAGYRLYRGDLGRPIALVVATYCSALFFLCLFCHAELYHRRPSPRHLTAFYFCVATGGALGAIFVGVVAPTFFAGNYELACGLCLAALLGLAATWTAGWVARNFWSGATAVTAALVFNQVHADRTDRLLRVRNFYGTLDVTQHTDATYHAVVRTLYNGVIEHGQQVYSAALRTAPTTYYGHPSGVGLALDLCCRRRPRRVGVIGLGTGTLAAYGQPNDVFRFYEINPAVERIAENYFTYLRDTPAHVDIVPGDARVSLAREAPQRYDVLAVDAFSGDAIPVHLLTSEALEVYRRHLRPNGIVAFHVSNRYLDLAPVVEQIAEHAGLKTAFISSGDDAAHDLFSADWVLVTANDDFLQLPALSEDRDPITIPAGLRRWTDDYNSLLPLLRRKHSDDEE